MYRHTGVSSANAVSPLRHLDTGGGGGLAESRHRRLDTSPAASPAGVGSQLRALRVLGNPQMSPIKASQVMAAEEPFTMKGGFKMPIKNMQSNQSLASSSTHSSRTL